MPFGRASTPSRRWRERSSFASPRTATGPRFMGDRMDERDDVTNLFALDAGVARAARAAATWRERLTTTTSLAKDEDPYEAHRRFAGKSLYDALGAARTSLVDVPLKDGLRRWVAELTLGRVSRE